MSYSTLGQPDVGLMTMTEMTDRVSKTEIEGGTELALIQVAMVARAAKSQWVIADGDTGNGNAMNAMRTVQLYEQAGASAIQIEDQVSLPRLNTSPNPGPNPGTSRRSVDGASDHKGVGK